LTIIEKPAHLEALFTGVCFEGVRDLLEKHHGVQGILVIFSKLVRRPWNLQNEHGGMRIGLLPDLQLNIMEPAVSEGVWEGNEDNMDQGIRQQSTQESLEEPMQQEGVLSHSAAFEY
jgi:hypothetical protein